MADSATMTTNLMKYLEAGIKNIASGERYLSYLKMLSKLYKYSSKNVLLIFMQYPNAQGLIFGNALWVKRYNRYVRPGEKAIKIFAPCLEIAHSSDMDSEDDETSREIVIKEMPVNVYDISQTEGAMLQEIDDNYLSEINNNYPVFFEALRSISPMHVSFENIEDKNIKGYCDYKEKKIIIRRNMTEEENIETLIHELAHATMHTKVYALKQSSFEIDNLPDASVREIEADSVAYAVCEYFMINHGSIPLESIVLWGKQKDVKGLMSAFNNIQNTTRQLIGDIDSRYKVFIKQNYRHSRNSSLFFKENVDFKTEYVYESADLTNIFIGKEPSLNMDPDKYQMLQEKMFADMGFKVKAKSQETLKESRDYHIAQAKALSFLGINLGAEYHNRVREIAAIRNEVNKTPILTVVSSDYIDLKPGLSLPLFDAERLFEAVNQKLKENHKRFGSSGAGQDYMIQFALDYMQNGILREYSGIYSVGREFSGIIDHISKYKSRFIRSELLPFFRVHFNFCDIEENAIETLKAFELNSKLAFYNYSLIEYVDSCRDIISLGQEPFIFPKMPQVSGISGEYAQNEENDWNDDLSR